MNEFVITMNFETSKIITPAQRKLLATMIDDFMEDVNTALGYEQISFTTEVKEIKKS